MYRYSFKDYDKKTMARALGRSLPISTKHAIEISNYLRGKKLSKAKTLLELAIEGKKAIPFRRFTEGAGHKKGIGPGKYVVKASKHILKLLKEVELNAMNKGIEEPVIVHISAKKASRPLHYGRYFGRVMKRTHVEVVVQGIIGEELEEKRKKKEQKEKAKKGKDQLKEAQQDQEQKQKKKQVQQAQQQAQAQTQQQEKEEKAKQKEKESKEKKEKEKANEKQQEQKETKKGGRK